MSKIGQRAPTGLPCNCLQFDRSTRREILAVPIIGLGLVAGAMSGPAMAQAESERPKEGDVLVPIDGTSSVVLEPLDVPAGGPPVFAWPMEPAGKIIRNGSRLNKVLLLRLDPATLAQET